MRIDRRTLLGGLAATFVTPLPSFAASITDATGRTIAGPDRVMGVYPAGPPAAVEIYTLAPDLLVGWLEPISPEARQFLLPDIAARPEIPRLTGRGDAKINVDALKSFKPDLIVDIGDVNDAYKALAERVQQESGIPYVLIDGHLDRMSASYRTLLGSFSAATTTLKNSPASPTRPSPPSPRGSPPCRAKRGRASIMRATIPDLSLRKPARW